MLGWEETAQSRGLVSRRHEEKVRGPRGEGRRNEWVLTEHPYELSVFTFFVSFIRPGSPGVYFSASVSQIRNGGSERLSDCAEVPW